MAGWSKKDIDDRIFNYSNEDLLHRFSELAGGDDYDGEFTDKGSYEFQQLKIELQKRLTAFGFIDQDFKWWEL